MIDQQKKIKKVLVIDATGAGLSFLSTGLILPNFSSLLGLSPTILYLLSAFAFIYFLYSNLCLTFLRPLKLKMIRTLVFLNSIYFLASLVLILTHTELLLLGRALLGVELFVLALLIFYEVHTIRTFDQTHNA